MRVTTAARRMRRGTIPASAAAVLVAVHVVLGAASTQPGRPASQPSEADRQLIRKLLRDATGRSEGPAVIRALDGMRASRVKLGVSYDTGRETQQIQRGIVRDLEKTIAEAWKAQRPMPTSSKSRQSEQRRRRQSQQPKPGSEPKDAQRTDALEPIGDERATHGVVTTAVGQPRAALRELRRGWGRLPDRDRDEVVQGFDQDFLTKYREWIERYYRALANPQEQ
jgi:hypothetical protein